MMLLLCIQMNKAEEIAHRMNKEFEEIDNFTLSVVDE